MIVLQTLLLTLLFLLSGCDVEVKAKLGNAGKAVSLEKPWQIYATNKETKKLDWWLSWHENRNECLKNVKYNLASSVHANWYIQPAGCMYVGSEGSSRYILYLLNKLYNQNVFMCIAKIKTPTGSDSEYRVIEIGAPKETENYRCILPE